MKLTLSSSYYVSLEIWWHGVKVGPKPRDPGPRTRDPGDTSEFISGTRDSPKV